MIPVTLPGLECVYTGTFRGVPENIALARHCVGDALTGMLHIDLSVSLDEPIPFRLDMA